jgi:hypothetical protein
MTVWTHGRLAVSRIVLVVLLSACSTAARVPSEGDVPTTGPASATPPASDAGTDGGTASSRASPVSVRRIDAGLRDRMRFSHRPGCPVPWAELRYLRLRYVGFDAKVHTGEMVVHEDYAEAVTEVFEQLYDARWPIRRMRLVDDFAGDDDRSMAANNTSGYNCRRVAGRDAWSTHSYGAAVDVNPVQNPYVRGSSVQPQAGRRFAVLDRSARADVPAGGIRAGDVVVRAFAGIGWEWGGDWSNSKDYQHFSATGR